MSEPRVSVAAGSMLGAVRAGEPVMRSTVHRRHAALGALFERRAAWEVPARYRSEDDEAAALRSNLGFADVSARGKVQLSGTVEQLLQRLIDRPITPQQTAVVATGGTIARIARDWAMIFVPPSGEGDVITRLEKLRGDDAMATDMTSAMSGFLIAGPWLDHFLSRSLTIDPAQLDPGSCAAAGWARIPAVIVVPELAAPAVELYVGSEYGRYAWDTISELAGELGGSPVGWRALESWGWS